MKSNLKGTNLCGRTTDQGYPSGSIVNNFPHTYEYNPRQKPSLLTSCTKNQTVQVKSYVEIQAQVGLHWQVQTWTSRVIVLCRTEQQTVPGATTLNPTGLLMVHILSVSRPRIHYAVIVTDIKLYTSSRTQDHPRVRDGTPKEESRLTAQYQYALIWVYYQCH